MPSLMQSVSQYVWKVYYSSEQIQSSDWTDEQSLPHWGISVLLWHKPLPSLKSTVIYKPEFYLKWQGPFRSKFNWF